MGMNEAPSADRVHIGIFGRRNAGKSSIINAVTGQDLAVVSNQKGTTTDPVSKAMELLPLGPVVVIDTPGLDDEGELGEKRMKKTRQVLNKTDIAVLAVDGLHGIDKEKWMKFEKPFLDILQEKQIPCVIAVNKSEHWKEADRASAEAFFQEECINSRFLFVSAEYGKNINELKECIAEILPKEAEGPGIIKDFLEPGDLVVLVIPIDSAAPKGRLILPQQQVIRECLEAGAIPLEARETELPLALKALAKKPKIIITDSQAFERVAKDTPKDIYLTSFSILFSRHKGDLKQQAAGAKAIKTLKDGDSVLISEGCTHHRQCGDIGTVKIPCWMKSYTGKELNFRYTSGVQFPEDVSEYALVVHCGGCMLNRREMQHRLSRAAEQKTPMTNYGIAIAEMHGILDRSLELFKKDAQEEL